MELTSKFDSNGGRKRVALFLTAAIFAYVPLLYAHFSRMWTTPEGQFFPFVFLAVVGLIYSRWEPATQQDEYDAGWGRAAVLCGLSLLFLIVGVLLYNPSAATISFIVACAGVFSVLAVYRHPMNPVSYTHLTLPTICSV